MKTDEFKDDDTFSVVLPRIVSDSSLLAVTRLLANSLTANPYYTVQNFLLGLSDGDLDTLLDISSDENFEDPDSRFKELILIAEMLALGEGLNPGTLDVCNSRVSSLVGFLAIEGLARKGLVKSHRQNMSFGDEYGDKIIVERLQD